MSESPETPNSKESAESTESIEATTPYVAASVGGGNCTSYAEGHNTHWIPAIRKYVDSPRQAVRLRYIGGNEFEVEFGGVKHLWFYHDPAALAGRIERRPDNFVLVTGTTFINYNWASRGEGGGVAWFNMCDGEITNCIFPDED